MDLDAIVIGTGQFGVPLAALVKVSEQLAWCDAAVERATKADPAVALFGRRRGSGR